MKITLGMCIWNRKSGMVNKRSTTRSSGHSARDFKETNTRDVVRSAGGSGRRTGLGHRPHRAFLGAGDISCGGLIKWTGVRRPTVPGFLLHAVRIRILDKIIF